MADLPGRREREDELAAAVVLALRRTQDDWAVVGKSVDLAREARPGIYAALFQSFSDSAVATTGQLGVGVGGIVRAADVWASLYSGGISKSISDIVGKQFSKLVGNADDLASAIIDSPRWATLAATDVTRAATAGGEFVANAYLVTRGMLVDTTWRTAADAKVCPICGPLDGLTRVVWERFIGQGPPAHPNCRCWLDYSWVTRN